MKILLISSLTVATGNAVTSQRLVNLLTTLGHSVEARDCNVRERSAAPAPDCLIQCSQPCPTHAAQATTEDVSHWLASTGAELVIAVHAYRSGRLLLHCPVPVVLVLGGESATTQQNTPTGTLLKPVTVLIACLCSNCFRMQALM